MERRTSPVDRRTSRRGGRRWPDHAGRPLVLIVDDHADSRELLVQMLQDTGVVVAEAATGRAGLARVSQHPRPSLILLDLSLPDLHGTEVVRALTADPTTRDIPVVALSAAVRPVDKEGALSAGCVGFIEKPVMLAEVVEMVRRLLAGTA